MTERIFFTNLFAFILAAAGCYVAHVAGVKYYLLAKERVKLTPAIVATLEAAVLLVVSIVLVQLK